MARPTVAEPTERLYEALGPMTDGDEERDWPLLRICDALVLAFVEQIWSYVSDLDNDSLGWEVALDPAAIPADGLPWLGQFVGVELTPNMNEADRRAAVTSPAGFRRGTRAALIEAVKRTLTGSKVVNVEERVGGNAYQLNVTTKAAQTPDATITQNAILSQKPIGLVFNALSIAGQTWANVVSKHATWNVVDSTYPDWDDVIGTPP